MVTGRVGYTNKTVTCFNGTVNCMYFVASLLYTIHLVVNSHVKDPGQSLINNDFTVISIVKSTFKE